jgi:hypothetical protein
MGTAKGGGKKDLNLTWQGGHQVNVAAVGRGHTIAHLPLQGQGCMFMLGGTTDVGLPATDPSVGGIHRASMGGST